MSAMINSTTIAVTLSGWAVDHSPIGGGWQE